MYTDHTDYIVEEFSRVGRCCVLGRKFVRKLINEKAI